MPIKRKLMGFVTGVSPSTPPTLADVLGALDQKTELSTTRSRDLVSAVKRLAELLGEDPARIPLDLAAIARRLAAANPIAAGISAKTLANIRSGFLAATKASGLKPIPHWSKMPLSPAWTALMRKLAAKRAHVGLSRFVRYASVNGIDPAQLDDAVIGGFILAIREGSLHREPNVLHRQVTQIWNEVARQFGLPAVTTASFRGPPKRIDWNLLISSFRRDVDRYSAWCGGADVFAANARPRALAPRTLALRRDQIHAAVTALVSSGVKPSAIKSLADLVTPENFKRILRQRLQAAGGQENTFNRDLAEALVQIGREWVKLKPNVLTELHRLTAKMPMPKSGLTSKNKIALRQFDDPAVLARLIELPERLWAEVKREAKPNFRTLAKAQAALGVSILTYIPLRGGNLTELTFGVHLFMGEGAGAISTLEIPSGEVKNDVELAFDIPPQLAKMLIEYRDRIAPKVIGHRPKRLFVNADGTPKSQSTVAWLIRSYLARRAGIVLTPHQFRHLSAKILLDAEPGSFEAVRQLLGQKNLKTTTNFYAGMDTRRAARHHHRLIERALEQQKPSLQRKPRPGAGKKSDGPK